MFSKLQQEQIFLQEQSDIKQNDNPYTVTEVSLILKQFVETSFKDISIKGEISAVKLASSGHIYFSLKDENAVLSSICWRNIATKFPLQIEDGMEVICEGTISTYPARSNYQLIVKSIKLAGEGALLAMLEERRKKLAREGLFDEIHKKMLPKIPQRIGIITSLQGAVIKDILHRLKDRFPTQVLVWDVLVQGSEAAGYVTEAIEGFNSLPEHIPSPDVIIIARGGGSIEDLWAFNEEIVVRAVYHSKIPIISAIGHETDNTLIDLVSDVRAPTPTAAAEFATPNKIEIIDNLTKIQYRLNRILPAFMSLKQMWLEKTSANLHKNVVQFHGLEARLGNLKTNLTLNFHHIHRKCNIKLKSLNLSPLVLNRLIQFNKERLHNNLWRMKNLYKRKIENISSLLYSSKKLLISYNHKNILERGFSIIRTDEGKLICSTQNLLQDSLIQIELYDGKVDGVFSKDCNKSKKKLRISDQEGTQNKLPF